MTDLHFTADQSVPLCVDLDRTLTPVDTLLEGTLAFIKQSPASIPKLANWWRQGNAYLRSKLAAQSSYDHATVPLRHELIEWLRSQRACGRRLVLVTSADPHFAADFAARLQLFDEIIAGDGRVEMRGSDKRRVLVDRFGERGFDYVGASASDGDIWSASRHAIVIGDRYLIKRVGRQTVVERSFPAGNAQARVWLKAIRIHQWAKNALVFIPAMLAHTILQPEVLAMALLGFIAFGLCASSAYLLNDLFDLSADRTHPTKRNRPFAAGTLSAPMGLFVSVILILLAATLAVAISPKFAFLVGTYYVLTWAYSIRLKRVALIDVMMLAALYTLRIIAGAAATRTPLSFWLLAFSVFIFVSLGFVKRYAELDGAHRTARDAPSGRGYGTDDLPLIMSFGTASGYCAIVVMALYLYSVDSEALYHHHKPLWLICPLIMFWISRVWTLTVRGQMHEDPIVFALRDSVSLLLLGVLGTIVIVSI